MWFYNLQVGSCVLQVPIRNFKKTNLRVVSSFIQVANLFCQMEIKLWVASCFLQAASCVLWNKDLKFHCKSFTCWKFKLVFTRWTFKMPILQIIIMFKSNFKEINLRKLYDKAVLTKGILTYDNWNIHQPNANQYKDICSVKLFHI